MSTVEIDALELAHLRQNAAAWLMNSDDINRLHALCLSGKILAEPEAPIIAAAVDMIERLSARPAPDDFMRAIAAAAVEAALLRRGPDPRDMSRLACERAALFQAGHIVQALGPWIARIQVQAMLHGADKGMVVVHDHYAGLCEQQGLAEQAAGIRAGCQLIRDRIAAVQARADAQQKA